jgi:hypothetical protein
MNSLTAFALAQSANKRTTAEGQPESKTVTIALDEEFADDQQAFVEQVGTVSLLHLYFRTAAELTSKKTILLSESEALHSREDTESILLCTEEGMFGRFALKDGGKLYLTPDKTIAEDTEVLALIPFVRVG